MIMSAARIVHLLSMCRPATGGWFVVAVVVDAIERLLFWWFTHISKKILKLAPATTDRNAASAIIAPNERAFVKAPLDHGCPRAVSPRFSAATCVAMSLHGGTTLATRLAPSGLQVRRFHWLHQATGAAAEPHAPRLRAMKSKRCPVAEALTGKVCVLVSARHDLWTLKQEVA